MRVKQSRIRSRKVAPAPLPQRRRSKRRASGGSRGAPPTLVPISSKSRTRIDPMQWLSFVAIAMTSAALIILVWTLTNRNIDEQAAEIRARTDQQVTSVAYVLAREVQDELQLVDQSLAIIQDDWKKDSDTVDLGAWRKQLLALTSVANDIFIANQQGQIVQGTVPQSIGMGFGTAYVTYPNGSLEMYDSDGTKNVDGKIPTADAVQARQFLMYIVRPLARPRGWWVGASYRSEGLTKLFAGANLGRNGLIGMADLKRGALQAIVGSSAQFAEMDIAQSELVEQMRKNDAGTWAGASPTDAVPRIIAFHRVPGRDMSVLVGITAETANQPLAPLAAMARSLAAVASLIVLTVAAIIIWSIATTRAAKQRQRLHERAELNLANAHNELTLARARALLAEPEVGTMLSSRIDGVARVDSELRLRLWNPRFAEFTGQPLDASSLGTPIEDLLRAQANAGLYGDPADADQDVATRLTILHTGGQLVVPPVQQGPRGEQITMLVRGVADGGHVIVLVGPENGRFAAMPSLPAETAEPEPETADESMEF